MLFFDEANALFGMRTLVRNAQDRYANQDILFFLQRLETYDGLVIFASNLVGDVDEAFTCPIEQLIHFPMPKQGQRRQIWQNGLLDTATLETGIALLTIFRLLNEKTYYVGLR